MRVLSLSGALLLAGSALAAPPQPDLILTYIEVVGTNPPSWEIEVRVANVGNADAGPFCVDLFVDLMAPPQPGDLSPNYQCVEELEVGVKKTLAFKAPPNPNSWWDAIADSELEVAESDEGNNVFSVFIP